MIEKDGNIYLEYLSTYSIDFNLTEKKIALS
ncbi:Uncharacterised protein [Orientia tsutsugamushi]|nr:hypothetical protein OTSTA763_0592 [Orientia tsutsugamushi str. TA763]SPP25434.1 Uncharacterised protein [Orientia tsutsugamushi]